MSFKYKYQVPRHLIKYMTNVLTYRCKCVVLVFWHSMTVLLSHWLQTDRQPIEWKMWFSCFPVLTGSAEAQVIWGGTVKRLLIAYFIGNISAKKYQNPFMCVKVIASKGGTFFETRCIFIFGGSSSSSVTYKAPTGAQRRLTKILKISTVIR